MYIQSSVMQFFFKFLFQTEINTFNSYQTLTFLEDSAEWQAFTRGPILLTWINFAAWTPAPSMDKYFYHKVQSEITYPLSLQQCNRWSLANGWVISTRMLLSMWLFIHVSKSPAAGFIGYMMFQTTINIVASFYPWFAETRRNYNLKRKNTSI